MSEDYETAIHQYRAVCPCGVSSEWYERRSLALESQDAMNGYSTPPAGVSEQCCNETAQLQTRAVPLEDLNSGGSDNESHSSVRTVARAGQ